MLLKFLVKDPNKRKRFAHIGAGIVILVHAYVNYIERHHTYMLFAVMGVLFLAIAFFHSVIETKAPWIDGVFFVIEGILSIAVAIDFFHMGKKALPLAYTGLAIFQFIIAFRKSRKGIEHHKIHTDLPPS